MFSVRYELVIFDCDGVLVDSELLSCQCLAEMLSRHGVVTDREDAMRRFLGRSASAVADHFLATTGRPLPPSFADELQAALTDVFRADLQVFPWVREFLATYDGVYCLASSSHPERLAMTLSVTGLDRYFTGRAFTAAMVRHGKPAPDLFQFAARKMSAKPKNILVIEDSVNGVLAGKAAGMTVWGFVGGSHHKDGAGAARLTEAGADRIFHSFEELVPKTKGAR